MGEEINLLIIYIFFVILNILLGIISIKYDSSTTKVNLIDIVLYLVFVVFSALGTMVWCASYSDCKDIIYANGKGVLSNKHKFRIR